VLHGFPVALVREQKSVEAIVPRPVIRQMAAALVGHVQGTPILVSATQFARIDGPYDLARDGSGKEIHDPERRGTAPR
jgi:hypothetical protein